MAMVQWLLTRNCALSDANSRQKIVIVPGMWEKRSSIDLSWRMSQDPMGKPCPYTDRQHVPLFPFVPVTPIMSLNEYMGRVSVSV